MTDNIIKNRLNILLTELNTNVNEISEKVGIPAQTLYHYFNGKRKPGFEFLDKMVQVYNININWLLTGEGTILCNCDRKENLPETMKASIKIIKDQYDLSDDDMTLILEEFLTKKATKETILAILRAKTGNKKAVEELEKIIIGMKMAYE